VFLFVTVSAAGDDVTPCVQPERSSVQWNQVIESLEISVERHAAIRTASAEKRMHLFLLTNCWSKWLESPLGIVKRADILQEDADRGIR
jgi:hypothetical protein